MTTPAPEWEAIEVLEVEGIAPGGAPNPQDIVIFSHCGSLWTPCFSTLSALGYRNTSAGLGALGLRPGRVRRREVEEQGALGYVDRRLAFSHLPGNRIGPKGSMALRLDAFADVLDVLVNDRHELEGRRQVAGGLADAFRAELEIFKAGGEEDAASDDEAEYFADEAPALASFLAEEGEGDAEAFEEDVAITAPTLPEAVVAPPALRVVEDLEEEEVVAGEHEVLETATEEPAPRPDLRIAVAELDREASASPSIDGLLEQLQVALTAKTRLEVDALRGAVETLKGALEKKQGELAQAQVLLAEAYEWRRQASLQIGALAIWAVGDEEGEAVLERVAR